MSDGVLIISLIVTLMRKRAYLPSGDIVIFEIWPPFFYRLIYLSSAVLFLHMWEGKLTEASDTLFLGDAAMTKRIMNTNDNSGLYPGRQFQHKR